MIHELTNYPENWREAIQSPILACMLATDRLADYSSAICFGIKVGKSFETPSARFRSSRIVWDLRKYAPCRTTGNYLGAYRMGSR